MERCCCHTATPPPHPLQCPASFISLKPDTCSLHSCCAPGQDQEPLPPAAPHISPLTATVTRVAFQSLHLLPPVLQAPLAPPPRGFSDPIYHRAVLPKSAGAPLLRLLTDRSTARPPSFDSPLDSARRGEGEGRAQGTGKRQGWPQALQGWQVGVTKAAPTSSCSPRAACPHLCAASTRCAALLGAPDLLSPWHASCEDAQVRYCNICHGTENLGGSGI